MATLPTEISAVLLSLSEKKDSLRKAFGELEEHRALIAGFSSGWTDLEVSLSSIHDALEKRYAEVAEKETKLEERIKEQQDASDKRASVIESREQASLARVQEQKDAAVAAIREQKHQWIEEKQLLQSQLAAAKSEPDSKPKQQDHKVQKEQVGEKSSGVSGKSKGRSKLDNVAGSVEASKCKPGGDVATDSLQKKAQGKQSSAASNAEDPEAMETSDEDSIEPVDEDASDDEEKEGSHKKDESSQSVVTARPELISLCEKMDGPKLYTYLTAQKKAIMKNIQKELPIAMQSASDPFQLVLQAIKEYEPRSEDGPRKKFAKRRSCIALLESLSSILDAEGKTGNNMSDDVKEKAKTLAESWKSKLTSKETEQVTKLDIQAFFLLLAGFRLSSKFNEDELCDLVIPICFRRKTSKLWRALGLAHKAPDVVDSLIKKVRHTHAISFVLEFKLDERYPPRKLLKTYMGENRKNHPTSTTAAEKAEFHKKELRAAKRVVKCVGKYKLEGVYPLERIRKRIVELEKLNLDERKRVADTILDGLRKARAINGPVGPFRPPDRFNGRGTLGRSYGSPYAHGGVGGYPYPAGGRGYPSSYTHVNYQYGGRPPYQGPYLR